MSISILFLSSCFIYSFASVPRYLRAAPNPVVLRLQPITKADLHANRTMIDDKAKLSHTKKEKQIKSKARLFLDALSIHPGENVTLNYDGWTDLKEAGLFYNLSTHPYRVDDKFYIEIRGYELPSIEFAPEVSVQDISSHPEVSGGVSYLLASLTVAPSIKLTHARLL
jgi:hypothetical protein